MTNIYVRLALIALLVFAGVSLWYGRVEERLQGKIPLVKTEAVSSPLQNPAEPEPLKTDYQVILTRNIFKASLELGAQVAVERSQADMEDLAETKMQLVLLGTVSGSKDDARAIIRNEKTKMEDIYHVGSEVHGAIITRVGRGKVVLQVNGREEVLTIKDTESGGGQQVRSSNAASSQSVMQTDGTRERPAPTVVPQRRISFRNATPSATEPAASAPADPAPSPPAEEPEKQGETLVPNDETSPAVSGKDEGSEQQAQ